uniref:oxysterol-binding protein 1 n=1 Tax=Ciona intestinalis TaxID=7719 RepID=UPI000180B9D8|nr:oxysterol-binding protein 1 [Ciona intestinalis]|eukprot:XP_002131192.1 oxysterol-binding protein 1 [Ciona intestinalis]
MSEKPTESDHFKGWLWKWTNYIKGYQRRWFVLSNGLLSYYRSQAEMAHTCRGTINLAGSFIVTEDSHNFMISNGGAQTFHLKASSEVERQRWITALELAKVKATRLAESDDSSDEDSLVIVENPGPSDSLLQSEMEKNDLRITLRSLVGKLDDLETCNDLISKHGGALQRALSDLESLENNLISQNDSSTLSSRIKTVNERATLFRITSTAMINACSDFLQLAQTQGKRWHKSIVHEREQRLRLEETVETLAKQHNTLERALHAGTGPPRPDPGSNDKDNKSKQSDEAASDDEDEFVDASDKGFTTEFVKEHRKTPSTASSSSIEQNGSSIAPVASDEQDKIPGMNVEKRVRRKRIKDKPNYSVNLWSIMKNCIGKDLSKIPMPINFNEPLSMLQRLGEDLEYSSILDRAEKCSTSQEQMAHVVAFSVSMYSTTLYRTGKPFNPLLGETYELDRRDDLGFRVICEQVSHHPPAAAMHVDSVNKSQSSGWSYWEEITLVSKFRGKYLNVTPTGVVHLKFHKSGNYYTWRKVTTTVHNIIVGKLWVDQSGDAEVVNHTTGDRCKHKYFPYSYFSRETPRKVSGVVVDAKGLAHYVVSGTWDAQMDCAKIVTVNNANKSKPLYKTLPSKKLWQTHPLPVGAEKMYFFTDLAVTLNEQEPDVAPTDSRLRPDQRTMEEGNWDLANDLKQRLEDAQRGRRRRREAETAAKKAMGQEVEPYKPVWFEPKKCPFTGEITHVFKNTYWDRKEAKDWSDCPTIFELPQNDSDEQSETGNNTP